MTLGNIPVEWEDMEMRKVAAQLKKGAKSNPKYISNDKSQPKHCCWFFYFCETKYIDVIVHD